MKTMFAIALTLVAGAPAAADTLKSVPTALNPAKAYILVEYRLMPNTLGGFRDRARRCL